MIPNRMDSADVAAVHHADIPMDDPLVGWYKLNQVLVSVGDVDNVPCYLCTMPAPPAI